MMFRQPRQKSPTHLRRVRQLPCLACGRPGPSEAAHVRYGDPGHQKRPTGMGERPDDRWSVPLCARCHRLDDDAQHARGERDWWSSRGIDPIAVAARLFGCQTHEEMETAILEVHAL